MARVHVCPYVGPHGESCPNLQPCPIHSQKRSGWSYDRDRAQHMRDARAAKRAQPYCTYCGSTDKLDYHHLADGSGIVICNPCHVDTDSHARAR